MASLFDKLKNILMIEEEIVDERVKEPVRQAVDEVAVQEERRVVNGNTTAVIDLSSLASRQRKAATLKVKVYTPQAFEQANIIANTLRSKEAVVVNYEQVSDKEQRRLCDFLNGCCYILGGGVQRISDSIVLYVPMNVEIIKEIGMYSVPPYVKQL